MERLDCETVEIYRSVLDSVKTNMYVLPCGRDVVVVDPHPDPLAMTYIAGRRPQTVWIFLTHEHPDHTLGVPWLRERFDCRLVCQRNCAERIAIASNNRPLVITLMLAEYDKRHGTHRKEEFVKSFKPYTCQVEIVFDDEWETAIGENRFKFAAAPGHSCGGSLITLNDSVAFTGDNLIPNEDVIFRFPGGDREVYESVTKPLLDGLPENTMILPGHGNPCNKGAFVL